MRYNGTTHAARRSHSSLDDLYDHVFDANNRFSRLVTVEINCPHNTCTCAFRVHRTMMVRIAFSVSFGTGHSVSATKGSRHHSPTNGSLSPTQAELFTFTDFCDGFYELLNESGVSVPFFTKVAHLEKQRPKCVLIRKDIKCIAAIVNNLATPQELVYRRTDVCKAGALLRLITIDDFSVHKSGKVKHRRLAQFQTDRGETVYIDCSKACHISHVATGKNISGAHSTATLFSNFRFPINVKPLQLPQRCVAPWPHKQAVRLTQSTRGAVFFFAPERNPDNLYVITRGMLTDHSFRLVNWTAKENAQKGLDRRINMFLKSYHPEEPLRYLTQQLQHNEEKLKPSTVDTEDDEYLMQEVDDIYFYVRHRRFPEDSSQSVSLHSSVKVGTARSLSNRCLVNPNQSFVATEAQSYPTCSPRKSGHQKVCTKSIDNLFAQAGQQKEQNVFSITTRV